jgi:hypothetical protein
MVNQHENERKWGPAPPRDFRFLAFYLIYIFEQVKRRKGTVSPCSSKADIRRFQGVDGYELDAALLHCAGHLCNGIHSPRREYIGRSEITLCCHPLPPRDLRPAPRRGAVLFPRRLDPGPPIAAVICAGSMDATLVA